MLVNMFYVLPFYGLAIYALIFPGCSWLPDWALVFAGAIGQVRWGGLGYVGPVLRKVLLAHQLPLCSPWVMPGP